MPPRDTRRLEKSLKPFSFPFPRIPLVIEAYFMVAQTFEQMDKEGQAETVLQNLLLLTDDIATKDRVHAVLGWMGPETIPGHGAPCP